MFNQKSEIMKKLLLSLVFALLWAGSSWAQTYLTEDFEIAWTGTPNAPSGWSQTRIRAINHATSEKDWLRNTWSGAAWTLASTGTNPTGAYSGTGVAWIDDYNYNSSSTPQAASRLESPVVDLSGSTSPYVRFWYFNNQGVGITLNLRVMVSADGGTTWHVLTPILNGFTTTNLTWNRISVAIPAAYRTANFKFAFELTNRWGSTNPFIDLVSVEEFTPTTITSAATGDWNAGATWVGGVVPTADNHVVIAAGHTVTLPTTTGIIGRCQNLNIEGTLAHSTGTAVMIHAFGNIVVSGTLNAFNGTSGRFIYCGGNFTINAGGTANFSAGTTSQATGTTAISTGAAGIVFLNNQSAGFTNSGTLTSGYVQNILHMGHGAFTYNSPVTCYRTFGLYLGSVNPNGNLTLGNAPSSLVQTIERANGSFTSDPIWNNTNISSRSNVYYSPNWVPITQTTVTTGSEVELISGTRTISGTLTMNTHNHVQLAYPLTVGTAATGTGLTLTRGIIITDGTNLLHLAQNNASTSVGTTPSTATPPTTHGSYIAGPLKRTFPTSATTTSVLRYFPLGVGTAFNGPTPNANVIKLVDINTGASGCNSQSPVVSIVGAPSGSSNAPLTTVMGNRAYRIDLAGGNDFTAAATIQLRGMNYTFGNSDGLIGTQQELRVAQSTALSGTWSERSATSGTGAIADNTLYSRSTLAAAPGPIGPLATYGEYFGWATTAPGMAYASSTTTQNTNNALVGDVNAQIIGIEVVTTGSLAPISLSSFSLSTNGTTNAADILNAKIYYTGTTNAFSAINLFGTATSPSGGFTINGSQTLAAGTNYFWLTYDISGSATAGNLLDAECNSITVAASPQIPTVQAPAGARMLKAPLAGTYTIGVSTKQDYSTITAAVADLNALGVSAPVTFLLTDPNYSASETFPIVIDIAGAQPSAVNNVTIKPNAGVAATITGSSASAIIKINGADYIIIDGSNSGGSDKNLTIQNTSTGTNTAAVWIASKGTDAGATYVTIRNCNLAAGSNSVTSTFGIYAGGAVISTTGTGAHNNNLTVQNNSIYKAHYGVFARGVATTGVLTGLNITGNIIGSDVVDNYIGKFGIDITAADAASISQNTIYNFIGLNTNPTGMLIGSGFVNGTISKNRIYSLRYTGTGGYGGKGIDINTGVAASNVTIANNVIYDLGGDGWSTLTSDAIVGIRVMGTTGGLNIYYNSINLYGSYDRSTQTLSAAIYFPAGITSVDLRNNILSNSIVNNTTVTSLAYTIYNAGANTVFSTINYNDYYASGTQGILGFLTANVTTLADWQTATGQDANSKAVDPLFNSSTNLQLGTGSPCLAAGTPIAGITTDITGVTRSVTAPAIGAFETPADVAPPTIVYTPLGNTTLTSGRTIVATITDASGVPTTAPGWPYLYWKKTGDVGYTGVAPSGVAGSQYTYNFGAGVKTGDLVEYYIVAQDMYATINVGAFPSAGAGVFTINPPAAGTPPTTPSSYMITQSLSGTFTVGTVKADYPSLTGDGGLFADINNKTVVGNIIANVVSDIAEPGTFALNQWAEEGAGNYTLTIQPDAATLRTLSGTYAGGLIRLNGADRVTIDGRFGGSGKYLKFQNLSTAANTAAMQIISLGTNAGAVDNTIRNCYIAAGISSGTVTSNFGIFVGGAAIGTTGTGAHNNNLTFQDNVISKAYYGIYMSGVATTGVCTGLNILGNTIGADAETDYILFRGIYLAQASADITQNTIYNIILNGAVAVRGIEIATGVTNTNILANKVYNIQNLTTGSFRSGQGISLSTGNSASNILVANNVMHGFKGHGSGTATNNMWGIMILGGGGYNIYYNSINLYHNTTVTGSTDSHGALYIASTVTNLNVVNNVFSVTATPGNVTAGFMYCVYSLAANTAFTSINYNDYYVTGTRGYVGYIGALSRLDLAAWQTGTAQDINSISANPVFADNTVLQPMAGSPVLGAGIPVSVLTDILGVNRSGANPSMGAYENEAPVGILAGKVTRAVPTKEGAPVEGALIAVAGKTAYSNSLGDYQITDILAGTYQAVCTADGYLANTKQVVIVGTATTTQDFVLDYAEISVNPNSFEATVLPAGNATEVMTITNPNGTGPLTWSAIIGQEQNPEKQSNANQFNRRVVTETRPDASLEGTNTSGAKPYTTCPDGSIFSQIPELTAWGVATSEAGPGYTVLQKFSGANGPIGGLTFWGGNLIYTTAWAGCATEDPMTFIVDFYTDDNGFPGQLVASYTPTITRLSTGSPLGTYGDMYMYHFDIDDPLYLTTGWVAVQGQTASPDCWFMWAKSSVATAPYYLQWTGSTFTQGAYAVSMCLTEGTPWLTLDSYNGLIQPTQSSDIDVYFNAGTLDEGTYKATLYVSHNGQQVGKDLIDIPVTFNVFPPCPKPQELDVTNILSTSALFSWTPVGEEEYWNVKITDPQNNIIVEETVDTPNYSIIDLQPESDYKAYVQAVCGEAEFVNPKVDRFWITIDGLGALTQPSGGAPVNDPGEDGTWYFYPGSGTNWYNIWFYNDPVDMSRMKKVKMGFWAQRYVPFIPADVRFVVNYTTPDWNPQTPGFPNPNQEDFILRSPVNGPFPVAMGAAQWFEVEFDIPDYNPEWVSVDVYGLNLVIPSGQMPAPTNSEIGLESWWLQNPGNGGGIIVHECLPKPNSAWAGPKNFTTLPLCPVPTNLTASNILPTSADLAWTPGLIETSWLLVYGAPGFDPELATPVVVTPDPAYALTGLTSGTNYEFRVKADCGSGDLSVWSAPKAFATPLCMPEDKCPYKFVLLDSYGDGWNGAQMQVKQNGLVVHTLGLTFTTGISLTEFVPLCHGLDFEVFWSVAGSWPGEVGLTIEDFFGNVLYNVALIGSANVGTTLFTGTVNCIPPACPVPTALTASVITQNSALLNWTAGGTETSWELVYGAPGFDPALATPIPVAIKPYTLSGLSASTTYEYRVRANCVEKLDSDWSAPYQFTTECGVFALPFTQDFEGTIFPPTCWNRYDIDGGGSQWISSTAYNHTPEGSKSAAHTYSTAIPDPGQNGWLVTPAIQLPAGMAISLSFWSYNFFPTFYTGNFVLVSTGSANPTSGDFTQIWTASSVTASWEETVLSLNAYAGQTVYIAFRYTGYDGHDWYLDDINITATPILYPVTFNVDVTTIEGFQHGVDNIYLAGDFPGATWNEPGTNPDLLMLPGAVTDTYTLTLNLPAGNYQYKHFRNAGWGGGEWPGDPNRNITVSGAIAICNVFGGSPGWVNLDRPAAPTISEGGSVMVYGQIWVNNYTWPAGQAAGLTAWVGVSSDNTDPSGWSESNWTEAAFDAQVGDNDEFAASIGSTLGVGTYYYAFRYRFGDICGEFVYGGLNWGFWHPVNHPSGVLTVIPAGPPQNYTATGILDDCYDALEVLTIENAEVQAGGFAEFKAGVSIISSFFDVFLDGTADLKAGTNIVLGNGVHFEAGSNVLVKIMNPVVYCSKASAIVAVKADEPVPAVKLTPDVAEAVFSVFPNPTTGRFTLQMKEVDENTVINVEIFGMMGERVLQSQLSGQNQYEFDLSNSPRGVYIVRVLQGTEMGVLRVIKQ